MKSYIILALLSVGILAGCSSSKKTADYDDVYYSTRQERKQQELEQAQTADPDYYVQSENTSTDYLVEDYEAGQYVSYDDEPNYSETIENPDGTSNITNNYYGSDGYGDYYDYSYSARINRFYNPYGSFGYYSPCYVGFYYDPWYNPWYRPSLYFSYGWGYPSYGYYPYNNYWYGYNNGYYNGYWDGYYASNYYGSNGSYYYGPRNSGSSNSGYGRTGSNGYYSQTGTSTYTERSRPLLSSGVVAVASASNPSVAGKRNENTTIYTNTGGDKGSANAVNTVPVTPARADNTNQSDPRKGVNTSIVAGSSAKKTQFASSQNNTAKKTTQDTKPRYSYKKPSSTQTSTSKKYQPGQGISNPVKKQPAQKYTKPSNANSNSSRSVSSKPENRSTVYSKPKSNSSNSYSRPAQYNNSGKSVQPARTNTKSYSQPSRSNTKSYSQPSRTNTNYSKPSNSGSSRSSYSRPSNSNSRSSTPSRSYSSPSRSSSGGSSGSRSSGGGRSSSGGRR